MEFLEVLVSLPFHSRALVSKNAHTVAQLPRRLALPPRTSPLFKNHVEHSQNCGYFFGVPNNEDYSILGSILGSPYSGKLPCSTRPQVSLSFNTRRANWGLRRSGLDSNAWRHIQALSPQVVPIQPPLSPSITITHSCYSNSSLLPADLSSQWFPPQRLAPGLAEGQVMTEMTTFQLEPMAFSLKKFCLICH